jgi:predicted membrane protein
MIDFPSSSASPRFRITPQLIIGVLITVVGVIFTLDQLGIAPATSYLRFWPSAIVAIGVLKMLQAKDGGTAMAGLIITALGAWLLAEALGIIKISLWQIWPVALVILGVYLVWQGMTSQPPAVAIPPPSPTPPSANSTWTAQADVPRGTESNSSLSAMAILGGVSRGNNSRTFRNGDLLAVMGGLEIDLRHAAIHGEAVIDLFVLWGGIEIRVPEDWTVVSKVVPVMAGVEDKTRPPQGATAHRLVLRGLALMGGVEIKN